MVTAITKHGRTGKLTYHSVVFCGGFNMSGRLTVCAPALFFSVALAQAAE